MALLRRWSPVVALCLLALLGSRVWLDLFFGTQLFPIASLVVFSLLWLGDRGLIVSLVVALLAMQQWHQPLMLVVNLAELLCLKLYLDHAGDASERRENGWIILADILFWVLIGIPLAFLLFGVVLNLDPASVLNLAIRQGINGAINAISGGFLYLLLRWLHHQRSGDRPLNIHGVSLTVLLVLIVIPSASALSLQSWELHQATSQAQLNRLRQSALVSAALESGPLQALADGQRQAGSQLEVRLLEGPSEVFNSNQGLFETLRNDYVSLPRRTGQRGPLPHDLDLIVPRAALGQPRVASSGYWMYASSLEAQADASLQPFPRSGLRVQVVEPARLRIQELEKQGARSLGILSWIVLLGSLLAESGARWLELQIPAAPSTGGLPSAVAARMPDGAAETRWPASRRNRSAIVQLDRLHRTLLGAEQKMADLRQRLLHSEQERDRLRETVESLSILDPVTGCFNRHELYRRLDLELRRSERENVDLSILRLEIDHLRQLRSSCGEELANEMLRMVAGEITRRSRTTDLVCRFAEDQFAVLLPSCNSASARRVGDLLREAIARLEVDCQQLRVAVTASIGVTCMRRGHDDTESLINRSENALYRAKSEGRNQVMVI